MNLLNFFDSTDSLWFFSYLALMGLAFLASLHAVMKSRTAQGATAWVVALLAFPILSLPLYLIFGRNRFGGYVKARRAQQAAIRAVAEKADRALKPFYTRELVSSSDTNKLDRIARTEFVSGHKVELLINGDQFFPKVFEQIDKAKRYVLLQSFIINDDSIGAKLSDHLIQAAHRGVRVYVTYDDISSDMTRSLLKRLRKAGIYCEYFNPGKFWVNPFQINFRNHRKLTIIDGKTAFLGGINFGEEYIGKHKFLSPWRDTHLELKGPAVIEAQLSFFEDWYWCAEEELDLDWEVEVQSPGQKVMVLATGPADLLESCELAFLELVRHAKSRLWIASPYFVPSMSIISALQLAKIRGIDVRLILPKISDTKFVKWAGEAYIEKILQVGVKVYHYGSGFMHQKVVLVDKELAMVGSANLDNRSFRLNFELMCFVEDEEFSKRVELMLEEDLSNSRLLKLEEFEKSWFLRRLRSKVAALFAPIL